MSYPLPYFSSKRCPAVASSSSPSARVSVLGRVPFLRPSEPLAPDRFLPQPSKTSLHELFRHSVRDEHWLADPASAPESGQADFSANAVLPSELPKWSFPEKAVRPHGRENRTRFMSTATSGMLHRQDTLAVPFPSCEQHTSTSL